MSIEIQGKVGPSVASDGSLVTPRTNRSGAIVTANAHGRYYESASRGGIYTATTASAGIAPGTALTATGALMLVNPANSGKYLSILKLVFGYVSGTLGLGHLWWTQGANPTPLPAETTAAIRSTNLIAGSQNGSDVAKAYSGVSLTTVPTILRPTTIALDPYAGTAAPLTLQPMQEEKVEGSIVIAPGFFVAVEAIAAGGTAPLVVLALEYENVTP